MQTTLVILINLRIVCNFTLRAARKRKLNTTFNFYGAIVIYPTILIKPNLQQILHLNVDTKKIARSRTVKKTI